MHNIWKQCIDFLRDELPSQQFNTWIRPLQVDGQGQGTLRLLAPNRFILEWVAEKYLRRIRELVWQHSTNPHLDVALDVSRSKSPGFQPQAADTAVTAERNIGEKVDEQAGEAGTTVHRTLATPSFERQQNVTGIGGESVDAFPTVRQPPAAASIARDPLSPQTAPRSHSSSLSTAQSSAEHRSNLNRNFTFDSFVVGKSNQLGLAAARQVADNPGGSYNPLFIYGGVGLGKTHLMQSIGNALIQRNGAAKVLYIHSERFLADMIKALQLNAMNEFKRYYRSVDALLIDDIQFLANKDRSQEEFFHTFNALLEGGQQIILTCDRYPKEIDGLEERLKSRFGWGLTVAVEPPELETRVAILMKKAEENQIELPNDAAFFIGQRIRSNVRELEGALKRVIANAHFTARRVDVDLVREALKDLLALQDKQVSIDNIQRVVAEYYKIKVSDLLSKRRNRSVARPRQVAMTLAKELTNHSLPEIGDSFGGRDHTTVLHACRKIKDLREESGDIREDFKNLMRSLTT